MPVLEVLSSSSNSHSSSNYGWKIAIFMILTLIFAGLSGYALGKLFVFGKFLGMAAWIAFLIFLVLFQIFFILETLFARGLRFWSIFLETIGFALAFYVSRNGFKIVPMVLFWSLGVWLILLLCVWVGAWLMRRRKDDLLRLRWNEITKRGLVMFLIGVNLFICLEWMGGVIGQMDSLFSVKTIDFVLKPSTPIMRNYFGENFDWNMMVDEFIRNLVTAQTEKIFEAQKDKLSIFPTSYIEQQKKALIEQNSKALKEQMSGIVGFNLTGTESLNLVAYQFLFNKYRAADIKVKQLIILIVAALMFIFLRVLAGIINLITRWIGWLVYELMIVSGFAAISTANRTKEDLILF